MFEGLIDLDDCPSSGADRENHFLSRALAAYSVHFLSGADPKVCAASITDASDDNGLDAIYYEPGRKILFLVQSKWIHDGAGEPDNGSVKKFVAGVRDLFNLSFDRFNKKIQRKAAEITAALQDHETTYRVVLAYTGINRLAEPSSRDLEDLLSDINDTSEVLSILPLNQSDLHKSLASGVAGEPITLDIALKFWGKTESPHEAYYGQVNGSEISAWWEKYQTGLFEKNLRNALGDTDVNAEIRKTIQSAPENFWYFNNGITMVCKSAKKNMIGGADRDHGTFHCENISIVNGAQTVSTIGRYFQSTKDKAVENISVQMRIIALGNEEQLGAQITKTNNRQNRIENRDFVRQDPEQIRIQTELAIDNIQYQLMRSDSQVSSPTVLDLTESTTALACASGDPKLVVQLKREIGKLWEDLTKAPYKTLFNPSVSGLYVWRCVQVQRIIDQKISSLVPMLSGREYGIAVHGNRLIAAMAFRSLNPGQFKTPAFDFAKKCSPNAIEQTVDAAFQKLKSDISTKYQSATLPTLFKNATKCADLFD